MRLAVISGGIVVNTIDAGEDWVPPTGFTAAASEDAQIGDLYVDGVFISQAQTAQVEPPDRVSRRQFFLQLEIDGIGPQVRAYVDTQPTLVQIAFDNSASFERADPMLQDGFAALGYNDGRVDKFFNDAGAL